MNEELYKEAIKKWGEISQLDMVVEECAELIKSIQKLKRMDYNGRGNHILSSVAEEVVDVSIMLEQMNLIFDKHAFKDRVEIIRNSKLYNLKILLKKQQGGN